MGAARFPGLPRALRASPILASSHNPRRATGQISSVVLSFLRLHEYDTETTCRGSCAAAMPLRVVHWHEAW